MSGIGGTGGKSVVVDEVAAVRSRVEVATVMPRVEGWPRDGLGIGSWVGDVIGSWRVCQTSNGWRERWVR